MHDTSPFGNMRHAEVSQARGRLLRVSGDGPLLWPLQRVRFGVTCTLAVLLSHCTSAWAVSVPKAARPLSASSCHPASLRPSRRFCALDTAPKNRTFDQPAVRRRPTGLDVIIDNETRRVSTRRSRPMCTPYAERMNRVHCTEMTINSSRSAQWPISLVRLIMRMSSGSPLKPSEALVSIDKLA